VRPLRVSLPSEETVALTRNDAERLVDALWEISATAGAVVAIGKIQHGLSSKSDLALDEGPEARAVRIVLDRADILSPALDELRRAMWNGDLGIREEG
jgi:hypothetical protein